MLNGLDGSVGYGDGVTNSGMDVGVGVTVGKAAAGAGVTIDSVTVCCPHAARKAKSRIQKDLW